MRVLVTGGAGFIGSAVCRYLCGQGVDVLNIDKLTYCRQSEFAARHCRKPHYRFLKADICDRERMDAAFADFAPDAVMHLAAESHVDRSIDSAGDFVNTNVVGTFTMLEAARRYWRERDAKNFRFLHVSTDEVYGSLGEDGLFSETTPYDPSSPYSASKAAADHLALAWGRTYGLPVLVSNCSNNYGPYHFPEKLIPLVILNALEGKPLPVYGAGANVRDWLYVDDHARALFEILQRGRIGEKYNVGGRSERANIDVVREICRVLDAHAPKAKPHENLIQFVTDRPGHDARYAIDCSKIERELGWRAQENLRNWPGKNRALVSRQRMVVEASAHDLCRRAARRRARLNAARGNWRQRTGNARLARIAHA